MAGERSLTGRVAAVTGAASGMGRVMACALANAGAKVAAVDVDAAGLDRLTAEPVFAGGCLNAVGDVSKTADCRQAVERVLERFGALDILINCAGISMSTAAWQRDARIKFFEADPEGWRRIVAVNTIGAFLMAHFAARPMIERGWGRIITVTTSFDTMLAAALSTLGEEARAYSIQQVELGAKCGNEEVNHPAAGTVELDELCALLESQNLAALDKFNLISPSLGETVGALRFDRLRNAIENLDFHQGAQLLREARMMGTPPASPLLPLATLRA
jgi:hypothetical protein